VTAAHDYSDLHELIDRLDPEQAEELREHALRLVRPAGGRFKVLRSFDGPGTGLPGEPPAPTLTEVTTWAEAEASALLGEDDVLSAIDDARPGR
jgi:hypothetical protein